MLTRISFCFLLLLSSVAGLSAQTNEWFFRPQPPVNMDTIFYPYYNDVQMIEIDLLGHWEADVMFHEMSQPRALSWNALIPGELYNVYLFRHRNGSIVKAFNTSTPLDSLTLAFRHVPADKKSTGISQLTVHGHATRHFSNWGDYRSRMNNFGGYYPVYTDSSLPRNYTMGMVLGRQHVQRMGLIDSFGNFFLPIEYTNIIPVNDHILISKSDKCGVIDKSHRVVIPMEYDQYNLYSDEEVIFYRNEKFSLIYDLRTEKQFAVDDYDYIAIDAVRSLRHNEQQKNAVYLFQFRKNGKTGLLDTNYKVVTPAVYDMISWYMEDRVVCCRDKKFGYLDEHGSEVIPCVYTYAEYFRQGVGVVQYEGKFRNIDKNGKLFDVNVKEHENWRNNHYTGYSNIGQLRAIHTQLGYGLVKANDVFVVPPIYENIQPLRVYRNGQYVNSSEAFIARRFDKLGIVDTAGNVLLPFEYESIDDVHLPNGFRGVRKYDNACGLINSRYELVVPCIYEGIGGGYNDEDFFRVYMNGMAGTMDTNGRFIIPPVYRQINLFVNGRALARKDSLYGFIDMQGNVLIPFAYKEVYGGFVNGLCGVKINGMWGFIDTTGTLRIAAQFEDIRRFGPHATGVQMNGKWGFINRKGKLITGYQYDFAAHEWSADGTCEVRRGNKIGFVDEKGREVIPCEYDNNWGYSPGFGHYLEKNGQRMYVKK